MTQTWTNLTIIVADADRAAAQKDFPDYFNTPASADGKLPATFWLTSGPFSNLEVDAINNDVAWDSLIRCPDWQVALAGEGLQMIVQDPLQNAK